MPKMYIAHRGLHNEKIPENSLKAFAKAKNLKLPIEFDVQLTKDNQVVVFHDQSLFRLTGIRKNVDKCTYEELRKYKLKDTDEKIPLLEDVLQLINAEVFLDIEIKHYKHPSKTVKKVSELMQKYKGEYTIKSFNPLIPYLYKKRNPYVKCGVLVGNLDNTKLPGFVKNILLQLKYLKIYKPDFVAYNINAINKTIIDKLNKESIPLHLYTIDNAQSLKKAQGLSDTIIFENIKRLDKKF